jgi:glycosyltransferase involved in cell wall biosynthesis
MIIAVNTRLLLQNKLEGIGRFANETLKIITNKHPEHQFVFIFDRKYTDEFIFSDNVIPVVCFPPARHPILWYFFFEWSVPAILRKYKADLFFSPDGWLSLRTPVKSIPVIHDLNFFHFPEFIPRHIQHYYNYFFPRYIKKARRIATVSEFSKNDIISLFNYNKDHIDVVYNGASEVFKPLTPEDQAAIRKKFSQNCPYFLYVGLIHPRKNLNNLILAFKGFKQEVSSNMKLLIVGSLKWWTDENQQTLEKSDFKQDIIFTGRIPDNDLVKITASALSLVYVSHFEGFGIPVLEAMYCDTPVIASGTSSLPEVGGDAVLYADPSSVDSIKSAMITMYSNSGLRKDFIERGRKHREKFTWEKTADLLWKSMERCF